MVLRQKEDLEQDTLLFLIVSRKNSNLIDVVFALSRSTLRGFLAQALVNATTSCLSIEDFSIFLPKNTSYNSFENSLRWLDRVFQSHHLLSLSINYVVINKYLKTLPAQMC